MDPNELFGLLFGGGIVATIAVVIISTLCAVVLPLAIFGAVG